MGLPFLGALRGLATARAEFAKVQIAATLLTTLFGFAAAALVCAAGLVALSDAFGFPVAALIGAVLFASLALGVMFAARGFLSSKMAEAAEAQNRIEGELALATSLTRSARPLLPLAAFIAVFVLTRRQ